MKRPHETEILTETEGHRDALASHVRATTTIENSHYGVVDSPSLEGALQDAELLGIERGIKIVVEWVEKYLFYISLSSTETWQSQLRKWGVGQASGATEVPPERMAEYIRIANHNAAVEEKRGA